MQKNYIQLDEVKFYQSISKYLKAGTNELCLIKIINYPKLVTIKLENSANK